MAGALVVGVAIPLGTQATEEPCRFRIEPCATSRTSSSSTHGLTSDRVCRGADALVESTLLTAVTAWQCSGPSDAMPAVCASDLAPAAMRQDFTDLVRRTTAVTASGLPTRRQGPAGPRPKA
ncbi:hypothetical protein [Streptomyces prasinus]|uniref:hypothetical protein n=1 Tax=Streptomyces prasinus TaxID=67345 RepID=UPI00367D2A58